MDVMTQPETTEANEYLWAPFLAWVGETVVIIGGGPSLRGFDWGRIHHMNVIGCNDAYKLGEWVDVVFFADNPFYRSHQEALEKLEQPVVSITTQDCDSPHIMQLQRENLGACLWKDSDRVGFYMNAGNSAIGLAAKFGARRIILLGFDHKLGTDGKANWHPPSTARSGEVKQTEVPFDKFQNGAQMLARDLGAFFPDVEVLNAGPDSDLDVFPHVFLEDVLDAV